MHQTLNLDKVNTYGLVYTWEGSDPSLKPTMLMAHQDVVPVNPSTIDQWSYPPYSGHYDGEFVWGRGASDCKSMLSGELEAITLLIKGGFKPRRTVILAFGFDEESKGWEGAGHIAPYLEEKYGKDSMAIILDEGGLGIQVSQCGGSLRLCSTLLLIATLRSPERLRSPHRPARHRREGIHRCASSP